MTLDEYNEYVTRERDVPLGACFQVDNWDDIEDEFTRIGLPKLLKRWKVARMFILAQAVKVYPTGRRISYSRNLNWYNKLGRYYGLPFTYKIVIAVIDQAAKAGLIDNHIEKPQSPLQSTFRATPKLVAIFKNSQFEFQYGEVIRLRELVEERLPSKSRKRKKPYKKLKKRSRLKSYVDTAETVRMRDEVETINAFLKDNVTLECPGLFDQNTKFTNSIGTYQVFDQDCVLVSDLRLFRSFCRGTFELGGRFFGWWQSQPKKIRANFILNGQSVKEPDFSRYHPHMLYAMRGIQLEKDAYDVPGIHPDIVKLALLALVNAVDEKDALSAIRMSLFEKKIKCARPFPAEIIAAIKAAHPAIADDFHNDMGVILMRKDSDIIASVMLTLVQEEIPFLPVHDSIICRESDVERVKVVMAESYRQAFNGLTCPVKS